MRMIIKYLIAVLFVPVADAGQDSNYEKLHEFFFEWRSFESPRSGKVHQIIQKDSSTSAAVYSNH